jgi:hypothetical protein
MDKKSKMPELSSALLWQHSVSGLDGSTTAYFSAALPKAIRESCAGCTALKRDTSPTEARKNPILSFML